MKRSFLTLWGPFLAALSVTFWLSSQSDVPGARYAWDKLLHTTGFAGLGVLALRAFHGGFKPLRGRATFYAGLTVILWGISDEFHQSFVPGRDATPLDVVADAVGFAVAVGIFAIVTSRTVRREKPR